MLNFRITSCVKNVKKRWINHSKISESLSTCLYKTLVQQPSYVCKLVFYNQPLQPISTKLSTYQNRILYLLNKSFTHNPQHLLLKLLKEN